MQNAWAWALAGITWDLFGTLTFNPARGVRRSGGWSMAWGLMRDAAEIVQRPYGQLLITMRSELGEVGGRFHLHFLLGGTRSENLTTLSYQIRHAWGTRGGFACIRVYDRSLAGAAYVAKCLSSAGANQYELGKFGGAEVLRVSRSVYAVVEGHGRGTINDLRQRQANGVDRAGVPVMAMEKTATVPALLARGLSVEASAV